jgi:redox-sensitive bicupin YhaK (pirin superfamily)
MIIPDIMSNIKQIQKIIPPPPVHFVGDGFRVHNFFPSEGSIDIQRMSPFLLMDYASEYYFSPTKTPRGVGVHPHRGFETVTLAFQGKVAHHDSAGNSGEIAEGDVQWMTAARGILHKEYHQKEFSEAGGLFQMVQLWVNLPSKYKMTTPKYQPIENKNIPKIELPENAGTIDIVAGNLNGIDGAADTFSPVNLFVFRLKKDATYTFELPENYNAGILVLKGIVAINDCKAALKDHFVLFANKGKTITVEALEDTVFLVLSGEPIDEPIDAYGPFVMNTRDEIIEAYNDFEKGKFGFLE